MLQGGGKFSYCWERHCSNEMCITFLLIWLSSSPKQFSKLALNLFLFLPSFFWARKELQLLSCSLTFLPNFLFPEWFAYKIIGKEETLLERILNSPGQWQMAWWTAGLQWITVTSSSLCSWGYRGTFKWPRAWSHLGAYWNVAKTILE